MTEPLFAVEDLAVAYGKRLALDRASVAVAAGETVALVGANGAGKSTLLKATMGLVPLSRGRVRFAGMELASLPAHARASLGIGFCPEGRHVFPGLSVRENLEVAARAPGPVRRRRLDAVFAAFPLLAARAGQRAWQLSGGQQQMLAIARALMGAPRLLLLDEPSLGLSPRLVEELLEQLRRIARTGTSVLIAEQNAAMALLFAERAYLMAGGRVVREGKSAELAASAEMRKAFLGG